MSTLTPLAALVLCAAPLAAQEAEHATWYPDFDQAVAAAREAKKDLLVDFTGSDWCHWCIKLHDEVFQHAEFLKPAAEGYVLVSLDFPNDEAVKAKVPNPTRNEELRKSYDIQGFPTILLMTPDGEVFGRAGYLAGGPAKYVEHLNEMAKVGRETLVKAKELEKSFDGLKGAAQEKAVREAIDLLAKAKDVPSALTTCERVARVAFELDPKNAKGLKLAAMSALLAVGKLEEEHKAAVRELDPKNEKGAYEKLVLDQVMKVGSKEAAKESLAAIEAIDALGIRDKETARQLYLRGTFWNKEEGIGNDLEKAKKFAQKLLDLGVEDENLKKALEEILNG